MTEKTDAEILAESREYLAQHGWTTERMKDNDNGSVCTLGAILVSQNWYGTDYEDWECEQDRLPDLRRLGSRLLEALGWEQQPCDTLSVVARWNDASAQSQQEVLDVFAKAEKIERAGFDPDKGVTV